MAGHRLTRAEFIKRLRTRFQAVCVSNNWPIGDIMTMLEHEISYVSESYRGPCADNDEPWGDSDEL